MLSWIVYLLRDAGRPGPAVPVEHLPTAAGLLGRRSWPSPTAPTTRRRRWASSRSPCSAPGVIATIEVPIWVIVVSATALSLGTAVGGWRIMHTMGHRVVELEPIHGFAAETTAASIISSAAHFGMPVSTTQVISSAIMGVGASRGVRGVRWGVARRILFAWVLTIPAAGLVGALTWYVLNALGSMSAPLPPPVDSPPAQPEAPMVRLIPKDEKFYDLFITDGENMLEAAPQARGDGQQLRPAPRAGRRDPGAREAGRRSRPRGRARGCERSFITPFDREDIHELVVHLDDVVDGIQATAETFMIYGSRSPTTASSSSSGSSTGQAVQLLEALTKLESRQGHRAPPPAVHDLEHKADALSRAAIGRLFEGGMDPLEVIKLRDLYTALEDTIDAAEDAAEVIERILAKS